MAEKRVTDRDIQLLLDMYKYRYLSRSQVEGLHFPSARTAYRRLQALCDLKYLRYFTVPGVDERVYFLQSYGAEVVASHLQVSVDDLPWQKVSKKPKDYYFLKHFLKLNDFRIELTKACTEIKLLGFIPDYHGEKVGGNVKKYISDYVRDITNAEEKITHTPDGVFALEKDGKTALFFVEIDRGTESLSNPAKGFLKAVNFYLNYWVESKFTRYNNDFQCAPFRAFRLLWVTNSEDRAQNMRFSASRVAFPKQNVKRFFWVTTDNKLTKDTIFTPIWQSLDITDTKHYAIG